MEWLFGKKKTPEEMLRENQRSLRKAMRYVAYTVVMVVVVVLMLILSFFG